MAAVPGSGKTHTLAALVAELLRTGATPLDADILIVTFTNSAVDNIRARVRRLLTEAGLPDGGYRVFTLHGLASAILRERPDLAGVAGDFGVDNEISGSAAMYEAVQWYRQENILAWRSFLPGNLASLSTQQQEKVEKDWREKTEQIGQSVTSLAKNLRMRAADVQRLLQRADPLQQLSPFLYMGAQIYSRYEHILQSGGRLDFDDLIWGAIRALENDASFRQRLAARFPFILEDEAQDSTPLQETILSLLAREHGNWVRVGDPNQAIMTTFTSSNVKFFRDFLARSDVQKLPLSVSGRSAQSIIDLANGLVDWCCREHPDAAVRARALSNVVEILPTSPGDPQQNPSSAASESGIGVQSWEDEDQELEKAAYHAARYVRGDRGRTCCILAPTNRLGKLVVDKLEKLQAPGETLYQDQLSNRQPVRSVSKVLAAAVTFCARPAKGSELVALHQALAEHGGAKRRLLGEPAAAGADEARRFDVLLRSVAVERLLFPVPGGEPLLAAKVRVEPAQQRALEQFGAVAARWMRASVLPIDQFMLTVAQDAFETEGDLALAHSLAVAMRRAAAQNPGAQLDSFAQTLSDIAANRQKFLSSLLLDPPFEPTPGAITVTTLHKAKGLEWDCVFMVGVNDGEFPEDVDGDFKGATWYLNNREPVLEARTQLQSLADAAGGASTGVDVDAALREAHIEYVCERMRLLYVGVTRARRHLVLSFSKRGAGGGGRERALAPAVRVMQARGRMSR